MKKLVIYVVVFVKNYYHSRLAAYSHFIEICLRLAPRNFFSGFKNKAEIEG